MSGKSGTVYIRFKGGIPNYILPQWEGAELVDDLTVRFPYATNGMPVFGCYHLYGENGRGFQFIYHLYQKY